MLKRLKAKFSKREKDKSGHDLPVSEENPSIDSHEIDESHDTQEIHETSEILEIYEPFDFDKYLQVLDHSESYSISRLTGGVVNITVRATKQDSSSIDGGLFPDHQTIILKHAPPFIAGVGKSAPMSRTRQDIEVKALDMFNSVPQLAGVMTRVNVDVPKVLHYDDSEHVIIISDLGNLWTLSALVGDLGGWVPSDPPSPLFNATQVAQGDSTSQVTTYFSQIGSRLGQFFGDLHSRIVVNLFLRLSPPGTDLTYLDNPEFRKNVLTYGIQPVESHLARFSDLIEGALDSNELYRRIEADWHRVPTWDEVSLTMGDCWPGAILVSPIPGYKTGSTTLNKMERNDIENPRIGVIDFEFAAFGKGPHGDLAQLFAHIECFLISARFHGASNRIQHLEAFMNSFIRGYKVEQFGVVGRIEEEREEQTRQGNLTLAPRIGSLRARVVRSAILAMGSEMMNVAFWKVWPCKNQDCPGLSSGALQTEHHVVDYANNTSNNKASPELFHTGIQKAKETTTNEEQQPSLQTHAAPSSLPESVPTADKRDGNSLSHKQQVDFGKPHDEHRVHLCLLIRSMAASAIWLLQHAGKDEKELCTQKNWDELRQGPPGWLGVEGSNRLWLLDLFQ